MKTFRKLRNQYIIFIGTVIVTIISSQVIIQYDLSHQNEDARLINLAGKQSLLEQRLLKLTLHLQRDFTNQQKANERLNNIHKISTEWRNVHYSLIEGNQELKLQKGHSFKIDSLLKRNTPLLEMMYQACQSIVENPTKEVIDNAILILEQNELPYLHTMEATVNRYQLEAEKKLRSIKNAEIVLATMAIVILLMEFIFIFIPILNKLRNNNLKLTNLSNNLLTSNKELQASEEEVRSNLDQISELQKYLEDRERHFRQLVEDASDMIYELNENGKFSYVNPIMARICGFSKEELEHKYYWDVVHPNKKEEVIRFYNKQRKDLTEFSYFELPIVSKNGEIVWVGQNVHMLYHEEWVTKVRVVARDITNLIKAREAMVQSEEKFRSLAEYSSMAIFQTNIQGETVYRNNRCAEIFGCATSFEFEKDGIASTHEEDIGVVLEAWEKMLSEHIDFHLEYRINNPKSGIRWINTLISKFKDPQGKPIGYIGNITDVTELKQAQQRIIENEKLYRELLENSRDLIALTSLEGLYIYVSNSVDNFLGYSSRELLETSLYGYVHPEDRELLADQFESARQGKSDQNIEYRLKRKDAGYFWVDSHIQAVADKNGDIIYYQTTSRDITLRKDYELAMKEAKARAEEATLAKSQFLSVMSHEIRTPMNAIIGLTNLLLQEQPRPDQAESLSLLKFSGENLLTIINDILDFSKIEAGKITLEYIDLDLHLLLKNIIRVLNQRADEKGIKLQCNIGDDVPTVIKGDPVRIGQILTNLVSNAIKFTERGHVKLTVTREGFENEKHKIRFSVQDTGIGIGHDKLDHIFERFTQASSDTTRKFGGTGLGLSITKKLLNLMDTNIQVESSIGHGSEFCFTLVTEKGHLKEIQSVNEGASLLAFEKRSVKILLVEDNKINQVVATNFLNKWNIQADIANNGKEAIQKILNKDYQLVLMDLQMPELDGYEATRIIRAMDEAYFKNVPIIALTASAMMDVKGKVLETGMNDFITKPFHPEELQAKIIQYVLIRDEDTDSTYAQNASKKLDLYSDGDNEFKKEIATLIIKNIEELQQSLHKSIQLNDVEYFNLACHKVKAALSMVDDEDFSNTIESIKENFQGKSDPQQEKQIQHFYMLCRNIIVSMGEEIKNINSELGLHH